MNKSNFTTAFITYFKLYQRDIKSSNILLRTPDHAVISDFGLAITLNNIVDSGCTNPNTQPDMDLHRLKRCGTPRYLSPELLEGPMDVHNFADAFRQGKRFFRFPSNRKDRKKIMFPIRRNFLSFPVSFF